MSTLVWSVVPSVQGRVPLATEGLSLVVSSYRGEDVIVAFGGYNGRYNNEKSKCPETTEQNIATLKAEKEELESSLSKEKLQSSELKQDLTEAETRNTDLYKEPQSVRGQLAAEQSRCFKLEVDVAELRQKLQTMETLQKELELLKRQTAASEQAALNAQRKSSGGAWGWLAGTPPSRNTDDVWNSLQPRLSIGC